MKRENQGWFTTHSLLGSHKAAARFTSSVMFVKPCTEPSRIGASAVVVLIFSGFALNASAVCTALFPGFSMVSHRSSSSVPAALQPLPPAGLFCLNRPKRYSDSASILRLCCVLKDPCFVMDLLRDTC